MADSNTPPADKSGERPIENLKAEMDRKFDALLASNNQLKTQVDNLLTVVKTTSSTPKTIEQPAINQKPLKDMIYDDPEGYARIVTENATKQAIDASSRIIETQNYRQQQLNTLVQEYPELQDQTSDLFREAVQNYQNLSEAEKNMPSAYKLAVREAAAKLGVMTSSKRTNTGDDSFSLGSGSGEGKQRASARAKDGKVANETLAFAELIGLNIKDPKVLENLKTHSDRKNWGKYR